MSDKFNAPAASSAAPLQKKIGWICRLVRLAALVWVVWSFGLFIYTATNRSEFFDRAIRFHGVDPASISEVRFWSANIVAVLVYVVIAYALRQLWRLMRGYLDGDIFSTGAAHRLRMLALAGLAAAATDFIARPLQVALMSTELIAKLPFWMLLSPNDLLYALIFGFLLALATIFKVAAELAEENAQIV